VTIAHKLSNFPISTPTCKHTLR